jgi:hypothetical protein
MTRKSLEEKARLIAECRESGLSKTEFARMAGIKYGTFMSWFARKETCGGFVEISDRLVARARTSGCITIKYKGVQIRLPPGSSGVEIVKVLNAIKEAVV